ncbi:MAG: arginine repressor [Eubacteriales bacterium]|nr:arginine repressor [Eubacteriales bacterium]
MRMNKSQRQALIISIIESKKISTQEELVAALTEAGAEVTQATISRDVRELNIVKSSDINGHSRYATMRSTKMGPDRSLLNVFLEATIAIRTGKNFVVVKTIPGLASGSAALIDAFHNEEVLGCVAGDDTIFIACQSDEAAEELAEKLRDLQNQHGRHIEA